MTANNTPLLKAAGLWKKVSSKGNKYFVGRWGGVRILVMANRARQDESEPTHFLFIGEAPDRPHQAEPQREPQRPAPRRRPYSHLASDRADRPTRLDDRVDDLWCDAPGTMP